MVSKIARPKLAMILRDKETRQSRLLGFATFDREEDAKDVAHAFNGTVHEEQPLQAAIAGEGKAVDKTDAFFTDLRNQPGQRQKIQFDEVAKYSVSNSASANYLTHVMLKLVSCDTSLFSSEHPPQKLTVTDGCACVGGNAISFALAPEIGHVNAVEYDQTRCKMLINNFEVYGIRPQTEGLSDAAAGATAAGGGGGESGREVAEGKGSDDGNKANVKVYCGSYLDVADQLQQDMVRYVGALSMARLCFMFLDCQVIYA